FPPPDYTGIRNPLGVTGVTAPVVTDSDGRFVIKGLGKDRWVSLDYHSDQVASRGTRLTTREGPEPAGARPEKIRAKFEEVVAPAVSVAGVVRDARTRKPLVGVSVRSSWSRVDRAVTDERGRYRINGLP